VCLLNRDALIVGVGNKVVEGVSAAAAGLASRRAVLHRHVLPPAGRRDLHHRPGARVVLDELDYPGRDVLGREDAPELRSSPNCSSPSSSAIGVSTSSG
jgi:hypothetical protein